MRRTRRPASPPPRRTAHRRPIQREERPEQILMQLWQAWLTIRGKIRDFSFKHEALSILGVFVGTFVVFAVGSTLPGPKALYLPLGGLCLLVFWALWSTVLSCI